MITFRAICVLFVSILHVSYVCAQSSAVLDDVAQLITLGKKDEASIRLNQYRREHPDDPKALLYRARLESDLNQAQAILKEVELLSLSSAVPDSALAAESIFLRATILFDANNKTEAKTMYETLLRDYPFSLRVPDSLYKLGLLSLGNNDTSEALAYFNICLERSSAGELRTLAATGRMESYVKMQQWQDALDAAHFVLEEPDEFSMVTPRVLEVMAVAWRALGNTENAERFTERLLETYPESYQAHKMREEGIRIAAEMDIASSQDTPPGNMISDRNTNENPATREPAKNSDSLQTGPQFAVQASAFSDRANAYRMYRSLKDKGFDVRIDMKTVDESHFYKVLVGNYSSRDQAEQMVNSVTRATGVRAFTVILD